MHRSHAPRPELQRLRHRLDRGHHDRLRHASLEEMVKYMPFAVEHKADAAVPRPIAAVLGERGTYGRRGLAVAFGPGLQTITWTPIGAPVAFIAISS